MASDLNLDTLLIEGQSLATEVASAISAADIERTIDGCPTLQLTIEDPQRFLLRQGYFAQRLTCQVDDHSFEIAQLKKSKDQIIITMEDLAVAELRRHTTPRKADPGTVTRVEFVRQILASETPWIQLFVDPSVKEQTAQVELARGNVASSSSDNSVNESYFGSAGGSDASAASSTGSSGALSASDIAGAAQAAGFSGTDLATIVAIAFAESSGIPTATNHAGGAVYYGLWQIGSVHTALLAGGTWSDPTDNAKMAYSLYVGRGGPSSSHRFDDWETYTNGAYKKFLGQAQTGASSPSTSSSTSDASTDYQNQVAALEGTAEDSWTCFKRIFAEVNWNLYADKNNLYAGPDSAFVDKTPAYVLVEFNDATETTAQADGTANVISADYIDFDWDVGKVIATCTIGCRAERWVCPPGTVVQIPNMGIPDKWICSSISRSLFSTVTTLIVKAPAPELPEPPGDENTGDVDAGYFGATSDQVTDGSAGSTTGDYIWPVNGSHTITSPFGKRARDFHEGIDIACPDGTPVFAARAGTITQVYTQPGGYGNVIYIAHRAPGGDNVVGPVASNVETRYAHLSSFVARRGQVVQQGQVIGLSGHSGDATGPHLHFEIRINGNPTDPQPLLSATSPVKISDPLPQVIYGPTAGSNVSGPFSDAELARLLSD